MFHSIQINNFQSLIIYTSILILIVKYISELKSNKFLVLILILFGTISAGFILNYAIHKALPVMIGTLCGTIIAPILFLAYLLKNREHDPLLRLLMMIPVFGFWIHYMMKLLHLPGAGIANLMMIVPIGIGIFVAFHKKQLDETKVLQVLLIFSIIDLLVAISNIYQSFI